MNKNEIQKELKGLGYRLKEVSNSKRIVVLVDGVRIPELEKIAEFFSTNIDKGHSALAVSSIGIVEVDGVKITVKSTSKQGSLSAGIENEILFIDSINKYSENIISISFLGHNKKFTLKNITKAIGVGRNSVGKRKSDVDLLTVNGYIIPISIKKDNAEVWESADSYWGKKAVQYTLDLVKSGKIKLIPYGTVNKIKPNFAVKATDEEKKSVVFGSDILKNKGAVITRTFSKNDFKYDESKSLLTIYCSHIIRELSDVSGYCDVWFLVRNDSTRVTDTIRGIRTVAVFQKRINSNILKIP